MKKLLAKLPNQSGATAIEYGLIAGLIAVVLIAAVTRTGNSTRGVFNTISNGMTTVNTTAR